MNKKVHFANLNTLRFIAASLVIVAHTEQIKMIKKLPNIYHLPAVEMIGSLSVDLFFVLSGFLITALLFIEQSVSEISIKNFIVRRLLRIWPLYFIIMILGFFIMPMFPALNLSFFVRVQDHYTTNIILYLLFLPHIQSIIIGPILYCAQAWSIGIEEQFYLIWPFVIKFFSKKKVANLIIGYTIGYIILSFLLTLFVNKQQAIHNPAYNTWFNVLIIVRQRLKFDCLMIGALFAIINNRISKDSFFLNRFFQLTIYLIEFALAITGLDFHGLSWEVHALLYGFIILNLVRTETSIF